MRELTVNRQSIEFKNSKIDYNVGVDKESGEFIFTTSTPHNLNSSSKVILRKEFTVDSMEDRKRKDLYTMPTQREVNIRIKDEFSFYVDLPKYILVEVENFDINNNGALLKFLDIHPYECVNDQFNIEVKSMGGTYYGGMNRNEDNIEDLNGEIVSFDKPMPYIIERGFIYVKNTWHLKDKTDGEFDDLNITMYESGYFLSNFIGLSENTCYKVGDDYTIGKRFLNDIMPSLIPSVNDNEKRQFLPAMAKGNTFKISQGIEFNLHFRSRVDLLNSKDDNVKLTDTWKTSDIQIWNNLQWKDGKPESTLEYINSDYTDDLADELNCLGFTENDIRFQKTKVKKSFIRLLFYSTPNMLDRELLFYSTIFLDASGLYAKYSRIKNENIPVFDENRTDDELRLSARFTVKNKYDTTKTSEGFYLYLFPNELKGENIPRTIYMRVEFNHAGYGKTIPLMMPREVYAKNSDGSYNKEKEIYQITNKVVKSTSEIFPTSFLYKDDIGINQNFEKYMDSLMIPVNIIYDKALKSYLYYFPWYDRGNENKIVINLWEPRMRGDI